MSNPLKSIGSKRDRSVVNNSMIAAADFDAPDRSMSHYMKNPLVMQHFVKMF